MVHTTQHPVYVPVDPDELAAFNKKNNKGKRLILDGIKDHCIPHVRGKRLAHGMWTTLTKNQRVYFLCVANLFFLSFIYAFQHY